LCHSNNFHLSTPIAFWLLQVSNIEQKPSVKCGAASHYFNGLISDRQASAECGFTNTQLPNRLWTAVDKPSFSGDAGGKGGEDNSHGQCVRRG
jgi:hypothetical protein